MSYRKIRTESAAGVGVITLADASTLNAAGLDLMAELIDAFDRFADRDSGVRCVVLTGEGRGFCSGASLAPGPDASIALDGDPDQLDVGAVLEEVFNPFISSLRNYPLPIVAAVNGAAAGVGCSLALAADLIVAAESAYFMLAFRRIGLVPDGGATYLLPRGLGKARAMELALLGERLPARTALEWGLINRCVEDEALMATAHEFAAALASGPKSLGDIRRLVWAGLDASWEEQLRAEREAQRTAGRTDDFREGVSAFREKRPAAFTGR